MTKLIYNYDQEGYYIGSQKADIDHLESKIKKRDVYLLPANATFVTMDLEPAENKRIKWNNKKWIYEDIPIEKDEDVITDETRVEQLKNQAIAIRRSYLSTTDWYILREYDQPNSYPQDIKIHRILAREQINHIEMINQLPDAQNIEQDYKFKINLEQQ